MLYYVKQGVVTLRDIQFEKEMHKPMKKTLALVLALVLCFALLAGCGSKQEPAQGSAEPAGDASNGSVYWLNFKPESDEVLQEVAKMYTEETGVPVKVVTAASGTYNQTLMSEMDKTSAPTLFVIGNQDAVKEWGDYALDLTDSAIAKELNTDAYELRDADGKLCSIGYCYECYGIIVNPDLIEQAGHTMDEIKNFESLKAVVEDIHARADELGFDAFTSCDMDDSSSWRFTGHMANLEYYYEEQAAGAAWTECPASITGAYLDNFKQAGLNCGTENYWAINSTASEADQQATMDFMVWCVTDPEASRMLVDSFGVMPYKQAAESTNGFLAAADAYSAAGNYVMDWATNYQPNVDEYRAALVSALNAYNADPTDANWDLVKTAFVDGWAAQYAAVNG